MLEAMVEGARHLFSPGPLLGMLIVLPIAVVDPNSIKCLPMAVRPKGLPLMAGKI